jgi:GT2 family glycosyltransferase
MNSSVLIPVFPEDEILPAFFTALKAFKKAEILFVNHESEMNLALLRSFAAHRDNVKILEEKRRGRAESLNRAVAEAKGEILLLLAPSAIPVAGWAKEMEAALGEADLVVGETASALNGKATPYGRLALKLFHGHSKRTAHAQGHALPWGPACNLGIRKSLFESVGPFSPEAAGAFDIDWCWRAVLSGASLRYAPKAAVKRFRSNSREAILREFDGYGLGEAWLNRTFSFLDDAKEQDPLHAGVGAFNRLRFHSEASRVKQLQQPLEEVAAAFGSGVRSGYERPHRPCAFPRGLPGEAIGWWSGPKEKTVFVPGKGLTTLQGKPLQVWESWQAGASEAELLQLFQKLFKAKPAEASDALEDFISSLSPAAAGWVPVSDHEGHHH